ncbi:MAG TPA: Amuc_1102 family pilus-like protein [Prosthecobacter sp.]|nr:Amuc_1102 family pilus-like protein [Prosthecobacter sp.]
MKHFIFLMAAAALVLPASAQETVEIKVKDLKISGIETPQFTASNVGDRRWRPKTWLELDLEFDVRLAAAAGGRNGSLDSMTVNYYIAFNQKVEGKTQYIKATFNYADIPAAQTSHALAYISPATLRRILMRDTFTASSDIQGWGYEILVDGKMVAGNSSAAGKWWESAGVAQVDGAMLAKKDTPFSILWGDYDVSTKKQ